MTTFLPPYHRQPDAVSATAPDMETLSNGVRVLRCGGIRNAIRAPYRLGLTAYAYLRWQHATGDNRLGGVVADRHPRAPEHRQHVYFLVTPPTTRQWAAIEASCARVDPRLRLLAAGGLIVAPPVGACSYWLAGDEHALADPHTVLAALAVAHRRHADGISLGAAMRLETLETLARYQQASR